ncbi:hypothetical protein DAPPUDRAFT_315259 [Daphnia pulex]|uniref:Uncharacterized protein n=1 Tax=Daphnia pulex TaxID=6669 RepID=E9G980_DAPPU|nr:hypothetical protein DAPPUDRAFT_315259 [Daphnia pulex]|eukprot:EFX84095.1 hypothetical protein DAPPUDRAFT_315259 [Daphnia pulex]
MWIPYRLRPISIIYQNVVDGRCSWLESIVNTTITISILKVVLDYVQEAGST